MVIYEFKNDASRAFASREPHAYHWHEVEELTVEPEGAALRFTTADLNDACGAALNRDEVAKLAASLLRWLEEVGT